MRYKFNVIEEGKEEPIVIEAMSYKKFLKRLDKSKSFNVEVTSTSSTDIPIKSSNII